MRTTRPALVATFALSALAGARPAAAQQRFAVATAPVTAPAPAPAAARTVATFRLAAPRELGMPVAVTVADSSGRLVARYQLTEGGRAYPMMVDAVDEDITLQAETQAGLLSIQLYQPDESRGGIVGRWWLDGKSGELRARTR